jgi:hypothetical protein
MRLLIIFLALLGLTPLAAAHPLPLTAARVAIAVTVGTFCGYFSIKSIRTHYTAGTSQITSTESIPNVSVSLPVDLPLTLPPTVALSPAAPLSPVKSPFEQLLALQMSAPGRHAKEPVEPLLPQQPSRENVPRSVYFRAVLRNILQSARGLWPTCFDLRTYVLSPVRNLLHGVQKTPPDFEDIRTYYAVALRSILDIVLTLWEWLATKVGSQSLTSLCWVGTLLFCPVTLFQNYRAIGALSAWTTLQVAPYINGFFVRIGEIWLLTVFMTMICIVLLDVTVMSGFVMMCIASGIAYMCIWERFMPKLLATVDR